MAAEARQSGARPTVRIAASLPSRAARRNAHRRAARLLLFPPGTQHLTRRMTMTDTHDAGSRRLAVFALGESRSGDGKTRWTRIGNAFENKDGSITLLL